MHRILFQVGNFKIYTYGFMYALATLIGAYLAVLFATKIYKYEDRDKVWDLVIYTVIGGIVGARLGYVIPFFHYYQHNLLEAIDLRAGGLSVQGGLIGGILVIWFFAKKNNLNFWQLMDWLTPAAIVGMAIGRIGCFFNGCCLGVETNLPWGVVFKDTHFKGHRHPTQLYEMFGDLLIFAYLFFLTYKKKFHGQVSLFFISLYSILRFLVEFVREGTVYWGPFTISQWFCIAAIIFVVFMYKRLAEDETNKV